MRPRSLEAVSAFRRPDGLQDGEHVVRADMGDGFVPGGTRPCVARVERHCWRCFSFRHPASIEATNSSAASPKVVSLGAASTARDGLAAIGSAPSATASRMRAAAARASARLTAGKAPSPISRRLPLTRVM